MVFNRALNDFEAERLSSDANSNGIADFWDTDPPVTIDLPGLPEGARPIQFAALVVVG